MQSKHATLECKLYLMTSVTTLKYTVGKKVIKHLIPCFLERAPGALIKKSGFFGGRFFEGGGANLKVGLFWGAVI